MSKFYTSVIQYGNRILFRGVDNGYHTQAKIPFAPKLFVKSKKSHDEYLSVFGDDLEPIQFTDINDAKEFISKYSDVENFEIFGNKNFAYQYITENYSGEIQFDISNIRIYSIDIETSSEHGFPNVNNPIESVLLISIQNSVTKEIITFGCGDYVGNKPNHIYVKCKDEYDLLSKFLLFWQKDYPNILTGWNIDTFDVPYLIRRMEKVLGVEVTRRLSPWNVINDKSFERAGKEILAFDILGVAILDYIDLYKKFTYSAQESYKLDYIAKVELGKQKLENPYDTFREFYTNDWQMFVDYNVIDTELVDQLEDKMRLVELIITMAYDAKCNYADVFSAVRTWDCIIYNHLWNKKVIVHQRDESRRGRQIIGAFVKEPVPGKYDWVVSFDATSLYPSIIMQYNMSPETMIPNHSYDTTIEGMVNHVFDISNETVDVDLTMAANGYFYKRDRQGMFPEIVQKLFDDRQRYKKLMIAAQKQYEETKDKKYQKEISKFNNFQMARKIQLNSLFGAWGNEYFRFYDDRIAEGITITGQYIIQRVGIALNEYLNKICGTEKFDYAFYSDTDSCYITLDPLVRKFYAGQPKDKIIEILDKICEDKIVKVINKACDGIGDYTNAFQRKIIFKREAISDRGIWVAKKRYALNVYDNEGVRYKDPKLKVMGLEIVKSSTPEPVRESLREAVRLALTSTEGELHKFIDDTESKFKTLKPHEIAFPRGVKGLAKYSDNANIYKSATPMHVRGSLLYNFHVKKKNLEKKFELIQEGEKIKFLYLIEPNPISENCIAFIGQLPDELGLTKFVDYNTMFEKSFIEPLNAIIEGMGWSAKPQASLASLFD
jgi:DNA polymerase elongation subunit (family B)